jgi:hypothetical protein
VQNHVAKLRRVRRGGLLRGQRPGMPQSHVLAA